jgi:hypothetical protein
MSTLPFSMPDRLTINENMGLQNDDDDNAATETWARLLRTY